MASVIKKAVSAILVTAIIIMTFASCGGTGRSVMSFSSEKTEDVQSTFVSDKHITSENTADLSLVASSGFISLYYDESTCSPLLTDSSVGGCWTALPVFENTGSCVLSVVLLSEEKRLTLNSQDNSIAFSSYSVNFDKNGYTVTYYMSDKESTVKKAFSSLVQGEAYVAVPVSFTLTDGNLVVKIKCGDIVVSDGYIIEELNILPYFGAVTSDERLKNEEAQFTVEASPSEENESTTDISEVESEDENNSQSDDSDDDVLQEDAADADAAEINETDRDFLLVPDGCGAVMYTDAADNTTAELTFEVYSSDDFSDSVGAVLGAYGIKKQDMAFAAIIDDGETLAKIKALRAAADKDELNRVYASFAVTPSKQSDGKYYYAEPYDGDISLCFRFMSGSEANYVSMAASCREELIRNGVLSSKTVSSDELPLNLSIIGSADGLSSTVTSTFAETEDILSVLKAKGINSINLILQGIFTGGLNQKSADSIKLLRNLGSQDGFDELCNYSSRQKFNIFAGVYLTAQGGKINVNSANDITGQPLSYTVQNPLQPYIGAEKYTLSVNAAEKVEDNAVALMTYAKDLNITGFCINDAAHFTYTDYSSNGLSREDFSNLLETNIAAFSTKNQFMLDGCNFNTIKAAYGVTDAPLHTYYAETDAYAAVPFVPVILHSTLFYSGKPANSYSLMQLELLKTVEYGAVPYFNWVFSSKSHLYYGNTLNEAVNFSLRAAKDLSDLSSDRISSHSCIQSGLYCTGYDNGSLVYVNYNNYSVVVGEISVPPFDYLRIN